MTFAAGYEFLKFSLSSMCVWSEAGHSPTLVRTVFDLGYLSDLAAMLSACPQSTHQTGTFSDDCMHFIVCVRPAATTLVSSWVQVADQYSYNISVFVVDNSDPDSALSDLELLTSYSHFELVVLGAEIDFCIKQALRQVHTHCSLGTQKAACI